VAISDEERRVASALSTLSRGGSHAEDHIGLAGVVAGSGANLVVVGFPLSLSGGRGPAATAVLAEVEELRLALDVPVELCDERFTTVVARQALAAGGRRPAARRAVLDKTAAAAILQTWLDRRRSDHQRSDHQASSSMPPEGPPGSSSPPQSTADGHSPPYPGQGLGQGGARPSRRAH